MSRLAWIAFLTVCVLPQASLHAASIKVTGANPRESITVTTEDARVDVILRHLRRNYGFNVAGLQKAGKGDPLTVTMSGSLHSILERLLRNRNHMIIRSRENKCGIAKVMILNSDYGAVTSQAKRKSARSRHRKKNKVSQKLRQAFSGADDFGEGL